jgi:hypothetical protein
MNLLIVTASGLLAMMVVAAIQESARGISLELFPIVLGGCCMAVLIVAECRTFCSDGKRQKIEIE